MKTQVLKTIVAALALGALVPAASLASSDHDSREGDDASKRASRSVEESGLLPVEAIVARLSGAGYSDIREVEREHGRYEVKGRNAEGQLVEIKVDARTGEILKQRQED
jgi:uncharacterized membrane protein YkoI